jgi:hypothetical protein
MEILQALYISLYQYGVGPTLAFNLAPNPSRNGLGKSFEFTLVEFNNLILEEHL